MPKVLIADENFSTQVSNNGVDSNVFTWVITEDPSNYLLECDDLGNGGDIQSAAITHTHQLAAQDIGNSGEVQSAALVSQTHVLTSMKLEAYHEIESVALSQDYQLACEDLDNGGLIERPALSQSHVLDVYDLDPYNLIQTGAITAPKILVAEDIGNGNQIESVALGDQTHTLVAVDLVPDNPIQLTALIDQTHVLTAFDLDGWGLVESVALTQSHPLESVDLDNSGDITSGPVDQEHWVDPMDLNSVGGISSGPVDVTHAPQTNGITQGDKNGIKSAAIDVPYGITKVYDQLSGIQPLTWNKTAIIEGKFGTNQGFVFFGAVEGTILSWQDHRIEATVVQDGRPDGPYDVHVDRVVT